MSSLRIARAALRARPVAIARPIQRRGYAEVANDKIKLSLALPHQVRNTSRRGSESRKPVDGLGITEANYQSTVHLQVPGCVRLLKCRPALRRMRNC